MVYKLKYLGANKNKAILRVYDSDVISKIEGYKYIDNPNVQNKFHKNDHKVSKNVAKQIYNFYKKIQKKETQSKDKSPPTSKQPLKKKNDKSD